MDKFEIGDDVIVTFNGQKYSGTVIAFGLDTVKVMFNAPDPNDGIPMTIMKEFNTNDVEFEK